MNIFQPMLASDEGVRFPCVISPKLDGYRATVVEGKIVSRTLKPIRNLATYEFFSKPEFDGLDGELIVGSCCGSPGEGVFTRTSSGVSTTRFDPQACFYVFDCWTIDRPWADRFAEVKRRVSKLQRRYSKARIQIIPHYPCNGQTDLDQFLDSFVAQGFEGVMARNPEAPYKFGRSTPSEGWLVKVKQWYTDEATVVGFEELMRNNNPAMRNNLGRTERSTAKSGLVPGGTLGKLVCDWHGQTIKIGGGPYLTAEARDDIWRNRMKYLHLLACFDYLEKKKNLPQSPQLKGFRSKEDV